MATIKELKKVRKEIRALGNVYGAEIPLKRASKCIDLIKKYTHLEEEVRADTEIIGHCMYAVDALFPIVLKGQKLKERLQTLCKRKDRLPEPAHKLLLLKLQRFN